METRRERKPPSWRIERQFGRVVGSVFVLVGAWLWWRGRGAPLGPALASLGAALVLLAQAVPRALVRPNRWWMALAGALAFVSTRVILGLVFLLAIVPIGVVKRLFGWDPLRRRAGRRASYWVPYGDRQRDPKHYEKMY